MKYRILATENRGSYSLDFQNILDVGNFRAKVIGLGGWLPSIWHFYDPSSEILHRGDGSIRKVQAQVMVGGGFLIAEEDATRVHEFDAQGRILLTRTGTTGQTLFSFSYSSGKLTSITAQPGSRVTTFGYDLSGNLASIIAPNGQITTTTVDGNGYLDSVTSPSSAVYEMTYGTGGLLATFEKPNGAISTFLYNGDGLLTKDSHSGGFFADLAKTAESLAGKTQTYTTKMGRVTSVIHEESQAKTIAPDGRQDTSSKDQISKVLSSSDRGINRTFGWQTHPRFGDMSNSYNTLNETYSGYASGISRTEAVSLSNPSDPFSISSWTINDTNGTYDMDWTYNPTTKTWSTNSKLNRTTSTKLDVYERPIETQVGGMTAVQYTYTNDKLTGITQGARSTTFSYNPTTGLLTSVTDPLSQTTSYAYNTAEKMTSVTLPDLRTISYTYDGVGNVTTITPPSKPAHTFAFDASELPSAYTPPSLVGVPVVATTYTYNDDKQVSQILRPDGQTIDMTYDATTGVLATVVTSAGTYSYNFSVATGLPNSIVSPTGFTLNQYSSGPHIPSVSISDSSYNAVWQYDNQLHASNGKIGAEQVYAGSGSSSISYTYNDDADLTAAGSLTYAYNAPNGQLTGSTLSTTTEAYTYNSFGEMLTYIAKRGATTMYSLTVTRDALGRVASKTQFLNGGTTDADVYVYDSAGRLTQNTRNSTVVATYGYDGNSNRNSGVIGGITTSATYDDQDRMTQYGVYDYAYNANGELTSKTNTLTSAVTSYNYDVLGNLLSVTLPSSTVISYEIDPMNRRIGRRVNGVLNRRYVYSNKNQLIAEVNASGNLTRRYVYGSKPNIPDYFIEGGNTFRIFSDHLGSPRVVIRVSNGTIMQKMDHDEFGRVRLDTNAGYTPFGFAGGIYDSQTGLVRFGARDYDPETGRWTSKDPIGFQGGDTNLMGYVAQDPVNAIDPTGTIECSEADRFRYEARRLRDAINKSDSEGNSGGAAGLCESLKTAESAQQEANDRCHRPGAGSTGFGNQNGPPPPKPPNIQPPVRPDNSTFVPI